MLDLTRFINAHKIKYGDALQEIREGCKRTHWMWYIFPQIDGLGFSDTARFYAIHDLDEAKAFLKDEYLGGNLREITSALLPHKDASVHDIFGYPDYLKLQSCMTLFAIASEEDDSIFRQVLKQFFQGKQDEKTLSLLSAR